MEAIIRGLVEKVGISEEQAKQVIEFLQQNAGSLPALLGSAKEGAAGGVAGKLGGLAGAAGGLFGGD